MLLHFIVIVSFVSIVAAQTQENYVILPNGTLALNPPPDSITGQSSLPTYNNPSYLEWLYSASDGIVFGVSQGVSPILDAALEATNSSCVIQNLDMVLNLGSSSPTLFTNWLVGFVILGVFGLCCGLSICITCIVVCCCRVFCKNCGASDTQNVTPGCTGINIIIWTPILLLLLAVSFLGCVFGILSYVSFNNYISNLPNNVDTSLGFLNNSISGIVDQLNFTIDTQLNSTFEATIIQVQRLFNTSFGDRLVSLASDLDGTIDQINALVVSVNMLNATLNSASNFVTNLNSEAMSVSTKLSNLRTECNNNGLSNCNSIPNSVTTGLSASNIPDISSSVATLNDINTTEISSLVANISTRVDSEINTLMEYFSDLNVLGSFDLSAISSVTDTFRQIFNNFSNFNSLLQLINVPPSEFTRNYEIAYKILLAISIILFCVVLVNIILAIVGAIITLVSYDHEAQPSMRKSSSNCAAKLLAISGYAGFCITWILAPILVALFIFGGISSTVCQPLVDRSLLRFITPCIPLNFSNIQVGSFGTFDLQLNISRIFDSCENDENLLQAFQAEALTNRIIMNVTDLLDNTVSDVRNQINPNVISAGIVDSYTSSINQYDTSQYNFDAANDITTELSTTQVSQQISQARTPVMNLISQIDSSGSTSLAATRASAVEILSDLDNVMNNLIPQANSLISSTTTSLSTINNELNAVNMTLTEASNTVNQFAANLSRLTDSLINDSIATLDTNVIIYTNYIRDNFPRCNFIPGIYDAFTDVTCRGIISNFNVYWFCLGWALFFLVISSIFSFVVARYGVRRDHETWFESDHEEPVPVPVGPRIVSSEQKPYVFANQPTGIPDQPPPVYSTPDESFEMKRFSHNVPPNAPVLTQLRDGSPTPSAPVAW